MTMGRPRVLELEKSELIDLYYENNESWYKVARFLKVSKSTIYRRLLEVGIIKTYNFE